MRTDRNDKPLERVCIANCGEIKPKESATTVEKVSKPTEESKKDQTTG